MLTTKAANEQRRRIRALITKWQKNMALNSWRVTHHFYHASSDMPAGEYDALALTRPSWQYLDAEIHWNLEAMPSMDDEYLETVFVHELMHIHLAGLVSFVNGKQANAMEERTATELALSFIFLDKARKK